MLCSTCFSKLRDSYSAWGQPHTNSTPWSSSAAVAVLVAPARAYSSRTTRQNDSDVGPRGPECLGGHHAAARCGTRPWGQPSDRLVGFC